MPKNKVENQNYQHRREYDFGLVGRCYIAVNTEGKCLHGIIRSIVSDDKALVQSFHDNTLKIWRLDDMAFPVNTPQEHEWHFTFYEDEEHMRSSSTYQYIVKDKVA